MSLQKVPDLMLHHLAKSTMLSLQKNKGSGKQKKADLLSAFRRYLNDSFLFCLNMSLGHIIKAKSGPLLACRHKESQLLGEVISNSPSDT